MISLGGGYSIVSWLVSFEFGLSFGYTFPYLIFDSEADKRLCRARTGSKRQCKNPNPSAVDALFVWLHGPGVECVNGGGPCMVAMEHGVIESLQRPLHVRGCCWTSNHARTFIAC